MVQVVKREVCAVITKGTMTEGGMLATCPDASYLLAITERITDSGNDNHTACVIGVCVADASTNRFMLGQVGGMWYILIDFFVRRPYSLSMTLSEV
jgi:DNA mismatch repair protein MSH6